MLRKQPVPSDFKLIAFNINTQKTELKPIEAEGTIYKTIMEGQKIEYCFKVGEEYQIAAKVRTANGLKEKRIDYFNIRTVTKGYNYKISGDKIVFDDPIPELEPLIPTKKRKIEYTFNSVNSFNKDTINIQVSVPHSSIVPPANIQIPSLNLQMHQSLMQPVPEATPFDYQTLRMPDLTPCTLNETPINREQLNSPPQSPARTPSTLFYHNVDDVFDRDFENSIRYT